MTGLLEPYRPLHVLKPFGPGIWIADGGVISMRYGPTALPFTTRMVVIRLPGGGLWLWSPVEAAPGLVAEVSALGEVAYIVSPNAIHYAHIPAWAALFPAARVWASPGVRERAASQGIEVDFTDDLGDAAPPDWAGAIDQVVFRGSQLIEEVVFFHRGSRTLVLADLIENFAPERVRSPLFRRLLRVSGALAPRGRLPLDLRLSYLGRHARAPRALAVMKAWAPEHIVVAHGDCFESGGVAELERAFAWV
ncbi:DUF4336 domain-containing protein [Allosediminivita pacifica]|uniref:Uncharacterized protein DUF4336 n=1 Tax=Allosediminivita pacifica TaxID=1267769 RepID=A0A2T6BA76_9RHOB|nr:DUF4336 domain-containing protein [Allosediminivita pacifica]PTX52991.1 uncharacterized protein DUF4336 [Allosediminivita pacifica]GGA93948.1 hypothetical protein GCM10011324_00630 [Allosediminivita pacifica]